MIASRVAAIPAHVLGHKIDWTMWNHFKILSTKNVTLNKTISILNRKSSHKVNGFQTGGKTVKKEKRSPKLNSACLCWHGNENQLLASRANFQLHCFLYWGIFAKLLKFSMIIFSYEMRWENYKLASKYSLFPY